MFDKNDSVPRAPPGLERRLLHSCSSEKEDLNNANNQVRNNFDIDLMSVSGTLSQTTISQDQHQVLVGRMMSSQCDIMNQALHGSSVHTYRSSSSSNNSVGSTTNNNRGRRQDHIANDRDLYQPIPANHSGRNPFLLSERLHTRDNGKDRTPPLSYPYLLTPNPNLCYNYLRSWSFPLLLG